MSFSVFPLKFKEQGLVCALSEPLCPTGSSGLAQLSPIAEHISISRHWGVGKGVCEEEAGTLRVQGFLSEPEPDRS